MNCFNCSCGCDRLTKEELENIIQSTDRQRDFVNNEQARNMFRRMIYPEETDNYTLQPSGSQSHPVGRRPKPRAIKYLETMEEAAELLRRNDLSEEEVEMFADRVPDETLAVRLCESTSTDRPGVLEEIIKAYWDKLKETDEYKKFVTNLTKKYHGVS